jgi:hypothetical protein
LEQRRDKPLLPSILPQENKVPQPDREVHVTETQASAGSKTGVMRWVLLISLGLAIAAMTIIWVTGALSQNDVESEGTTTGREEAQAEAQGAPDAQ